MQAWLDNLMNVDIIIVALYLILTLIFGIKAGFRIKNPRDYALSSEHYTTFVLVTTIFATIIGSGFTVGVIEQVYRGGITPLLAFMGYIIGTISIALFIAPYVENWRGKISCGEIIGSAYGTAGQVVTGLAGFLFSVGVVAGQTCAIGYLTSVLLGVSYTSGVIAGAGIVVLYCTFGGIRAVTVTDILQFIVLIISIPLVCNCALHELRGFKAIADNIPQTHLQLFHDTKTIKQYLPLFLVYCIPGIWPPIIQRLLMARDAKQARNSYLISGALYIPFFVMVGIIGLTAVVLIKVQNANEVFPLLLQRVLPEGIKGLVIAGILAVIMSTADSHLNAGAVCCVRDFIKPLVNINPQTELLLLRIVSLFIGLFGIIISLYFKSIIGIVLGTYNFWAIVMVPLIGTFVGYRTSQERFWLSIGSGCTAYLIFQFYLTLRWGISPLLPALIASTLTFFQWRRLFSNWIWRLECWRARQSFNRFTQKETDSFKSVVVSLLPSLHNLKRYSAKKVILYGEHGFLFGLFSLINFILPFYMWSPLFNHYRIALSFRILAGVLCLLLMLRESWSDKMKPYWPLFWHFTLLFCLPFLATYMLLDGGGTLYWFLNMVLAALMLVVLVDWQTFTILFSVGCLCGFAVQRMVSYIDPVFVPWDISPEHLYAFIYMFVFSVLVGLIFSRRNASQIKDRIQVLRTFAGTIALEVAKPLARLRFMNNCLREEVGEVLQSIRKAFLTSGKPMPEEKVKSINDYFEHFLDRQNKIFNETQMFLNSRLQTLQGLPEVLNLKILSIYDMIRLSLENYAFDEEEKKVKIETHLLPGFVFKGDEVLFTHLIHNLLRNALASIRKAKKGTIEIRAEILDTHYLLRFKDTGKGIDPEVLPLVFEPFINDKRLITGISLSFCREVMEAFGGSIHVNSSYQKFTEFFLLFPKHL